MKYIKRPVVVDAITFDEFVEYGRVPGSHIVGDTPRSFEYNGHKVTYENDACYLIPTLEGVMKFTADDVLITGIKGEIYPCKKDIFEKTYEPYYSIYECSRSSDGHWEFRDDGPYGHTRCYCSICGKHSGIGGIRKNQLKPYCPNCGAKMNGEES